MTVTTRMNQLFRPAPLTAVLVGIVAAVWFLSASYLDLTLFSSQKSVLLLKVGAVDGATLSHGEIWRLVTSQFLHVHFLHMLFNLFGIYVLANSIEHHAGTLALGSTYFVGGTVGQYFSVSFHPDLVSSGASQALMALCGFVLAGSRRLRFSRFVVIGALVISGIQAVLDIAVSASIKSGHGFGFAAGVLIGLGAIVFLNKWSKPKNSIRLVAPSTPLRGVDKPKR